MKKYTEYSRTTGQELLALDSIYKILTANERILLHLAQKDYPETATENIFKYWDWIDITRWKSPFMKYPEFHSDQLYYEDKNGELQPLDDYPKMHPKITEQILKL